MLSDYLTCKLPSINSIQQWRETGPALKVGKDCISAVVIRHVHNASVSIHSLVVSGHDPKFIITKSQAAQPPDHHRYTPKQEATNPYNHNYHTTFQELRHYGQMQIAYFEVPGTIARFVVE